MTFSTLASPGVSLQGGGGSGGGGTASLPISGNGATITTSTPLIDGTQTWNSGATTFTSLLLNVTDTASAAASLLMDLQVGGSSRFNVGKTGSLKLGVSPTGTNQAGTNVTIAGSQGTGTGAGGSIIFQVAPAGSSGSAQNALATALTIASTTDVTFAANAVITGTFFLNTSVTGNDYFFGSNFYARSNVRLASGIPLGWSSSATAPNAAADLTLFRDAANTLALRNGANAQVFRVYNTTDGTNSEFGKIAWSSNVLQIGTEKAGTGTGRGLALQADGVTRLEISSGGTLGISGSTGWADENQLFWQNRCVIASPSNGVLKISNRNENDFDRLQFGGTTSSFPALKRSSTTLIVRLADDTANAALESASLKTDAPAGGTAATWKLGTVASVSPTSPNRTIEVDIGGTIYYLHAKTTND